MLELPGANPLKDAHAALDAAVLDAYGFSAKKDLLKQLLDLNLAVAKAIDKGEKVTVPGVPASYGDAGDLVTDDCIRPCARRLVVEALFRRGEYAPARGSLGAAWVV